MATSPATDVRGSVPDAASFSRKSNASLLCTFVTHQRFNSFPVGLDRLT